MHSAASPTHNPLAPGMDSPPPWFSKAHALLPHPQWRDPGETQPWAMPIVLEIPKSDPPERTALLEAAAQAVVACCLDPRAAENDSAYRAGLSNWYGARIRKLARRARGQAWQRVQLAPGVTCEVHGARARALVPTPVAEVYPEVAKLQISGTDLPHQEQQPPIDEGLPTIWVDRDLDMSVGKVAAQVGHGSMLYAATLEASQAWQWAQRGYPLAVRELPRAQWPDASLRAVEVRDAGFTEIAPGSVTVAVTD